MIEVAPALPPGLPLLPISRRPLVLPPETVRWALGREVPSGTGRTPEASVVVVTHGNLPVTRLCLETVLAGDDGPGIELIVVDNASCDATPAFLAELASRHQGVRYLANASNLGFAAAVNLGLDAASSDLLVVLNNDVIVPPRWLDRLLPLLDAEGVGMVGPVTNAAPNEARVPAPYTTYGGFLEHAEARWAEHGPSVFDIDVLTMFCLALRRDVFRSVGPLDDQFGLGMFEDDDYARRVRGAGLRLVCADGVYVHHFGEASFGELVPTGQHGELFRRNRTLFERKWGRPWSPHQGRVAPAYLAMLERIRAVVEAHVPPGATVAVVSKGDDALLEVGERTGWHFPCDAGGGYAGHHPADAAEVIARLRDVRDAGVTHLVLPATSRWWLDHYAGLDRHLGRCCALVVDDDACTIFCWREDA
jgi:GT2 family glycosyltransferase